MKTKNKFIFARDISVFAKNSKSFKENIIDGINLDISSGEVMVIISEKEDESEALTKSLSGLIKIDKGLVFFENDMILGNAPNLEKMNLSNRSQFKYIERRFKIISEQFNILLDTVKVKYFLYAKNLDYNIKKNIFKKIEKKDNIIKSLDEQSLKDISLLARYGWKYVSERKIFLLETILYLKRVLKSYIIQERFVNMLFNTSYVYSDDSYIFLLKKFNDVKNKIYNLRKLLLENYFSNEQLKKNRVEIIKYKNVEDFYKDEFKLLEKMNINYKKSAVYFKEIKPLINQICALTSRDKKKEKFVDHYNKEVYLNLSSVKNKLSKIDQKTITDKDKLLQFEFLKNKIDKIWDKKTFNFKAMNNFFNSVYKDINVNSFNMDYLSKNVSNFKNSDLENKIKYFFENNILNDNFDKNIFNELFLEYGKSLKVAKKDLISDMEIVNAWKDFNNIARKHSLEKENEYIKLLKYLGNSSLNVAISKSQYNKKITKYKNRELRRNIQVIFKDASGTMNSKWNIEDIVGEGLANFPELYLSNKNRKEYDEWYKSNIDQLFLDDANIKNVVTNFELKKFLIIKTLREVGLSPEFLTKYPQELFENQIQKVALARALIMEPKFIIAENPLMFLDLTVKQQIISLVKKLASKKGIAFLILDSDLFFWKNYADTIGLMRDGRIVEIASSHELIDNPVHEFTKSIIKSTPKIKMNEVYDEINTQTKKSLEKYILDEPSLKEVGPNHFVLINDDII